MIGARMLDTIQRAAIAILVLCVLSVVASGCGGPPRRDRSTLLKALNRQETITARGGEVGSINFGSRSNDEWPFEAIIVDNQGQRLGVVNGTVNKGESISLEPNHTMVWLRHGAATWAPVEWE